MKIFMRKKLSETIKNRCRCCFNIQKRNILLCPLSTLWRSLRQKYNAMKRVSIRFHKSSLVKHDKFFKRERICHFLKLISSPFKSKKEEKRKMNCEMKPTIISVTTFWYTIIWHNNNDGNERRQRQKGQKT